MKPTAENAPKAEPPLVSVVLALHNDDRVIGPCLRALAAQSYPQERLEVLVVDAGSTDATLEVVDALGDLGFGRFVVLSMEGSGARGRNAGLAASRGGFVLFLPAAAALEPGYVAAAVELLTSTGAAAVGGVLDPADDGAEAGGVALAVSSPFAVGGWRFNVPAQVEPAEALVCGFYRRAFLEGPSPFVEELIGGDEEELVLRMRQAGKTMLRSPRLVARYHLPGDLRELYRQYFVSGRARVEVMGRHPRRTRVYDLLPPAVVATTLASTLLAPFNPFYRGAARAITATYAAAALAAALAQAARRRRARGLWWALPAFACLHLAYGSGFLVGLLDAALHPRRDLRHPEPTGTLE